MKTYFSGTVEIHPDDERNATFEIEATMHTSSYSEDYGDGTGRHSVTESEIDLTECIPEPTPEQEEAIIAELDRRFMEFHEDDSYLEIDR